MKATLLTLVLLLLAGCGGQAPPQVNVPPNVDIRADVQFKGEGDDRHVEVTFYLSTPVPPGDKSMPPATLVPVEEPAVNGQALTQTTCESGAACYTGSVKPAPTNVVTARINGKPYEGKTIPGSSISNKVVAVTMVAK